MTHKAVTTLLQICNMYYNYLVSLVEESGDIGVIQERD